MLNQVIVPYFLTTVIIISSFHNLHADPCGINSNTYCLNERQYISCGPLTPGGQIGIYTCPTSDYFCADTIGTCTSNTEIPRSTNTQCGECSANQGRGHTCTSLNTYKSCFDGLVQEASPTRTCADGLYCGTLSANSDYPCAAFTGREILCWRNFESDLPGPVESTSVPSVTTDGSARPLSDDEQRCLELGEGNYEILEDYTCRT